MTTFDLNPSRILMPSDYAGHDAVNVSTSPGFTVALLDLTGGNAMRCGVPADVIRYSAPLLSHKNTNGGGPEELACVMME